MNTHDEAQTKADETPRSPRLPHSEPETQPQPTAVLTAAAKWKQLENDRLSRFE